MSAPRRIRLSWHEVFHAAMIGVTRQVHNLRRGNVDRNGARPEDGWTLHVNGALGECIVAKATARYWSGAMGDYGADDVGSHQVRMSPLDHGKLILHKHDRPDRIFILVTGGPFEFCVHGWILCKDGQQERWWGDPSGNNRPAYFVPQDALNDIQTLPRTAVAA